MSSTYYLKKGGNAGGFSFQEIHLGDVMNSGAEGTVYKIQGKDSWQEPFGPQKTVVTKKVCAKIYSPTHLAKHGTQIEKKLHFMGQHRPQYLHDGPNNMIQICYPFGLLYDRPNGAFVGMLMYLALDGSASMSIIANDRAPSYYQRLRQIGKIKEMEWNIYQKFQFLPNAQPSRERYVMIHNIAALIHQLHVTRKYVIVDMKPENFLITIKGGISLVDVDSVQVSDGREKYPSLMATPDYVPPEFYNNKSVRDGLKDESFDRFSMAVIFYKVLTGTHPYCFTVKNGGAHVGTSVPEHIQYGGFACGCNRKNYVLLPQHNRFDHLPAQVQDLFKRAFEGKPEKRPSALEWKNAMANLLMHQAQPPKPTSIIRKYAPKVKKTWKKPTPVGGTSHPHATSPQNSTQSPITQGARKFLQKGGLLLWQGLLKLLSLGKQGLLRLLSWGKPVLLRWFSPKQNGYIKNIAIATLTILLCVLLGALCLNKSSPTRDMSIERISRWVSFPQDLSGNYIARRINGRNDINATVKVYNEGNRYAMNVYSPNITRKYTFFYDPSNGVVVSNELGMGKAIIKEYTYETEITFEGWELLK